MAKRKKKWLIAVAALVLLAGAAALLWQPALRWYRRAAKLPDENGMYQVGEHWLQSLAPLDEASVQNFAKKLLALQEKYLTDENQVFYAIVPDKAYFLQDSGYPVLDYARMDELLNTGLAGWPRIDLTKALSLEDYYYTDNHWRQEKLGGVVDALGKAMGFTVDMSAFTAHQYEGFVGAYGKYIPGRPAAETLVWLTSADTDSAVVNNWQYPDMHNVYDTARLDTEVPYDLYLSGASPVLRIENAHAASDKELIIFRDSYASALAPLLVGQYRTITLIDLRYMASALLPQYVEFTDQDVLFLYSTWVVNSSAMLR